MEILNQLTADDLRKKLQLFWELSGEKIKQIDANYDAAQGSPVFTVKGKYTARGWTEWTQGFQFGSSVLQFDATGDIFFLESGRKNIIEKMASHLTHTGVHDHGFNNLSTYGNLLRLINEGKMPFNSWEKNYYELALKVSGAVQAGRWTKTPNGGFIYSFNGPHSLFVDTIRTVRVLMAAHLLGHTLQGEGDVRISLLERAIQHMETTALWSVYYGNGRDSCDVWGRTAHESIFNISDGAYRCPNSQQGFSGFTTWTRGLAWAMLGFAEELELLQHIPEKDMEQLGTRHKIENTMVQAARATCDFYIENTTKDGIPFWDAGALNLHRLTNYKHHLSDPFNDWEPVDSSAAAIGAQALLRLGNFLKKNNEGDAEKYWQAGLTVADTLLNPPYLSTDPGHQGLLLHSIYHHPNGWDYIPEGKKIPCGESSMWGDYHLREMALYLQRFINNEPYYTFFNGLI